MQKLELAPPKNIYDFFFLRNSTKSMESDCQGTTHKFLNFLKGCLFLVVSIILPTHLSPNTAFLQLVVHQILVNSLVCTFQVRSADTAHGDSRASQVLEPKAHHNQGPTLIRVWIGTEDAFTPLASCVHGKENWGPEGSQAGSWSRLPED